MVQFLGSTSINYHGGTVYAVPSDIQSGYKPNIKKLKEAFETDAKNGHTIKTVIVNYPNNPTGASLTEEEAKALAEVFNNAIQKDANFVLIIDNAYEDIYFGKPSHSILPFLNEKIIQQRTIVLGSASKTSALADERIGYAASLNTKIIQNMKNVNSAVMLSPPIASQKALSADLEKMNSLELRWYPHQAYLPVISTNSTAVYASAFQGNSIKYVLKTQCLKKPWKPLKNPYFTSRNIKNPLAIN